MFPFSMRLGRALVVFALLAPQFACSSDSQPDAASEPDADALPESASGRFSYGAAYGVVENFSAQFPEQFDPEGFLQGVQDAVAGRPRALTDEQLLAAQRELQEQERSRSESAAQRNLDAGNAFLAENGAKEGVTTTESGLQYEVMHRGDAEGASPVATDTVLTHYTGRLIDGTVFDSSEERGEPISFGLNRVIAGWTEALQLMRVGDRFRIWVPPELGYGATQRPGSPIPPNSVLEFEVELLGVNP